MKLKPANILLEKHLAELGLDFVPEFPFCEGRRWRADYVLPTRTLNGMTPLIEIEGGIYVQGRHTRGKGYENDMRKYNKAQSLGYCVLRFSTNMVMRGEAKAYLAEALRLKNAGNRL